MTSSKSTSVSKETHRRHRRLDIQKIQNVLLIWLDSNIDDNNEDCQNTMTQLRHIVNDLNIYTDGDRCIQFIETIKDRKGCMIISGSLGQLIVPQVHDLSEVDSIFIFCGNKQRHEGWAKEWPKIKGVFTDIKPICEALKQAAAQCEQNAVSMSFVSSGKNKDIDVSLLFAKENISNPDLVAILFVMTIDPKQSTTTFASIRHLSAIEDEDEVLFSMHSVFRIQDIKQMGGNNKLFEVSLTLTSDSDKDLHALTERIREESFPNSRGWYRLGLVLTKLGQNDKAEEIYEMLLDQATKESDKAPIYHQLDDKDDIASSEKAPGYSCLVIHMHYEEMWTAIQIH
ncbi:hypothetical protein I4U23_000599 [Adineta vaga]|nr:hypothetical protein I4U23_000599 [Adineta vaga]